jgi:hypothetical protein
MVKRRKEKMTSDTLSRGLFDLVGYMLTSARGLVDEPPLYGPFRLIDGASRLCEILAQEDEEYSGFYKDLKSKIDARKYTVMTDTDTFINLMDELVYDFTKKLKER